jgi:DNA-binding NarL/FixJ family response regulator
MQVLIVDNNLPIIKRLKLLLSELEKIETISYAFTYKEAIKVYMETKPEVVIIDTDLPAKDCFSLLLEIKGAGLSTKLVVLYNNEDEDLKAKCKSLGADYLFDKYHEFEKIPATIKKYYF